MSERAGWFASPAVTLTVLYGQQCSRTAALLSPLWTFTLQDIHTCNRALHRPQIHKHSTGAAGQRMLQSATLAMTIISLWIFILFVDWPTHPDAQECLNLPSSPSVLFSSVPSLLCLAPCCLLNYSLFLQLWKHLLFMFWGKKNIFSSWYPCTHAYTHAHKLRHTLVYPLALDENKMLLFWKGMCIL